MKIRPLWMLMGLFVTGLSACGGGGASSLPTVESSTPSSTTAAARVVSDTMSRAGDTAASYTAINAGGPVSGNWVADTDFNGGTISHVSTAIDTRHASGPAPQAVYQTQRFAANLVYTLPNLLPNGTYNVRLHFAETYFSAASKRQFNVKINGHSVLTNFDIFQQAGGANLAIVKSFLTTADAKGTIVIALEATVNNAMIAGIELIGGSPSPVVAPGISINGGGGSTGSWSADTDYSGGWTASVTNAIDISAVTNAASQAVYQSQRTGATFMYTISNLSASGAYLIRLHFVESWFTVAQQRQFNVTINGAQVLSNFDTFAAAGGTNIAVIRPFNVLANSAGKLTIQFTATKDNASIAGIEVIGRAGTPGPAPSVVASLSPPPQTTPPTASCAPTAVNPIYSGCFRGNSPYHHTVASLMSFGGSVSSGPNALNYWNNGNPLQNNTVGTSSGGHGIWTSSASNHQYSVSCPAYGICDAATSVTGKKIFIPSGAAPSSDSDHHFSLIDQTSGQEIDMWGGYSSNEACQVGTYTAGQLTCSWGGTFAFSGDGLATTPGDSGNAGGVAFGMAGLTAGDILSGHITHALGMLGPCLDNGGIYPGTPGRSSDYPCEGGSIPSGAAPADPSVPYGALLALKQSVNLNAPPYSNASQYCKVVIKAYQEYGFYTDDNSSGYGLRLILNNQADPGWNTINASMIAGGDASGSSSAAGNGSCLNRIDGRDLEYIKLNQGDGTIPGGTAALPPITAR